MKPAVFLDRDNTLIHNDGDLGDPGLVRLIQGAGSAIASLCGLGYKIVVVTNQGGVARGKYTEDDVRKVHDRLRELVEKSANGARIDAFYYCPYHPDGTVEKYKRDDPTRKPQPGMLQQAADDLALDLSQSWTIGDQLRDVEAGKAAGTRTILLHPSGAAPVDEAADDETARLRRPDFVARNLIEAVRIVAQQRKPDPSDEAARHVAGDAGVRKWDAAAVAKLQQDAKRSADDQPPADKGSAKAASKPVDKTPRKTATRPFRPWGAADELVDDPASSTPASAVAEPASEPVDSSGSLFESAPAAAVPAQAEPAMSQPASQPVSQPAASGVPAQRKRDHEREPASPEPALADEPGRSKVPVETTLRQILHELRHQRGADASFSYSVVLAIVLQMVAGLCLLGALWMGAGDFDLFFRWMGAGLLLQGATIAALLFPR